MDKVDKPWGHSITAVSTNHYSCIMHIIKEGEETEYAYNKKRDKTIFVLQGIVHLNVEGSTRRLEEGMSYHIGPRLMHKIHAVKGDATILDAGTKIEYADQVIVKE